MKWEALRAGGLPGVGKARGGRRYRSIVADESRRMHPARARWPSACSDRLLHSLEVEGQEQRRLEIAVGRTAEVVVFAVVEHRGASCHGLR